jgi:hypothetical protein
VETLAFAIVVLGPLHYLTELAWLWRRGVFVAGSAPRWTLVAVGTAGAAAVLGLDAGVGAGLRPVLQAIAVDAMVVAAAVALVATRGLADPRGIAVVVVAAVVASEAATRSAWGSGWLLAFGLLLPTVVHVLLFTALFMAHGATTAPRDNLPGLVGLVAGTLVLALTPALPPEPVGLAADLYEASLGFLRDAGVALWPGAAPADAAARVTRLLAFAYTHHFLNWFEKTGRIGWARQPSRELAPLLGVWLALVLATLADARWGLALVFVPNVLHVVLELPLNWRTADALAASLRRAPAAS